VVVGRKDRGIGGMGQEAPTTKGLNIILTSARLFGQALGCLDFDKL